MTVTEASPEEIETRVREAFAAVTRWRTPSAARLSLTDLRSCEHRDALVFAPRDGGEDRWMVRGSRVAHYGADSDTDADAYGLLTRARR